MSKDDSINIHPTDKGDSTCVRDQDTYLKGMEKRIEAGHNRTINQDPTTSREVKLNDFLKHLMKKKQRRKATNNTEFILDRKDL